ncbi:hypothetical protein Tco_1097368, partial [Tanacetum coccineum]
MDVVLDQISNFKRNINIITKEVQKEHKYETPMEGWISILEETLNSFIKESLRRQKKSVNMVWEIKKNYDQTFKAQASSIKKIESHLGKIAELIQDREEETDMEEDHKFPIILGRPFLATAHAMIDVFNKKISFKVRNETVTFDIEKSMRFASPEDDTCLSINMVDLTILDNMHEILPSDPLDSFLFDPIKNYHQGKIIKLWEDGDDEADQSTDTGVFSSQSNGGPVEFGKSTLFTANTKEPEKQIPKLKELPYHLEYAFLDNNQEFSIIISSSLSCQEKELILRVLSKHKAALAWKVADIKGISPSFCTHKILMEDNFKPIVQPQRRLNPKVQDV